METEYARQFSDFLRRNGMEGVLVVDHRNNILAANWAAESLLGYGDGQLKNLRFADFWKGGYPLPEAAELPQPQETELIRADGAALPVSLTITPANRSRRDQHLVSFVGRAELDRLNESLLHAQRLAGIGTLTASVAHELTNPISIITATCTNVIDELNDESITRAEIVEAIELIEQSAFRCARIVEVLRNYAYTVSQDSPDSTAIAITSPAAILEDALTMVEQQFRKQARVTVEVDLQPDLTTVFCDHHRIAQVLINLLLNARDAMQPGGGVIRVKAWALDPSRELSLAQCIRTTMKSTGDVSDGSMGYFAFSVADTGCGIDPVAMQHLFEPFYTTKPNGQGTGLGLFIAKGIVSQHGGCIFAENNPGGGSTFTVVLPRRP